MWDRDAFNENMASRLEEKSLQLSRKMSWDASGVVLSNVYYKVPFREFKVGKYGSYRVMVYLVVNPHFDGEAIR